MTNVLVIMADELSTWGLGCLGGTSVTPCIDALADRGQRFDCAYTPSPICVPARASIATGQYLHRIGNWSSAEAYDGTHRSWGHVLQDAGIPTTSIGKLHYRSTGDPTGFDTQIEPIHIPGGIGWVRGLLRAPLASYDVTAELSQEIGPGDSEYIRYDRTITRHACDWLSAAPDEPWCTFVSFLSPHYPLVAPQQFYDQYDPTALASEAEDIPDHPILRQIAGFFDHDPHFTPKKRGIARAAYFGLCSFFDAQVAEVLRALERSGQADDTVILLTSDHGEMLGHKGMWTKSVMYDDAARIPLIAAGPGFEPGIRTDPVSLVDLAPTICQTMGVDHNFPAPPLTQPAQDRTVFSEYHDGGAPVGITMVRWGKWKYVHYARGHPPQLFDLEADPNEMTDLSGQCPDILDEARRRMTNELDPEAVDERAHADQAALIANLGGRAHLEAMDQWNFTPADSR